MAGRVKVSLSVDSDMLARARAKSIDLDELFEHALRRYGCEDLPSARRGPKPGVKKTV